MLYISPLNIGYRDVITILIALLAIVVAATIVVIIRDRKDPVKALAWIMVVTLLPVLGLIIYVVFGRNHRKEKMFNRKEISDLEYLERLSKDQLQKLIDPHIRHPEIIEANRGIITLLLNNNKSLLTVDNSVRVLPGAKEKFDALHEAIRNAKSSIHLEYYIFKYDYTGRKLVSLLAEKVRAGVEVRLIYDDLGSWGLKRRHVKRLQSLGIEVCCFMPVMSMLRISGKLNYRNHRKIVVIDGKVGFTGGINIADRYVRGTKFGPWRDTHLRIEGDAVNMLQAIFMTDWYFLSGKQLLNDGKYYPASTTTARCPMQIASSGPDSDWAAIMQAYFAAISKAHKSIYITTPYFLPNQAILTALKVAALGGIDVRIIMPNRSDSKIVYWASRSYVTELLDAGIKVYFYCKGFNHSKIIIVDEDFSSVGSANMDYRSFEDNFEVAALMYDPVVTRELTRLFFEDIDNCVLITPENWDTRSNLHAAYESIARLFSPLM